MKQDYKGEKTISVTNKGIPIYKTRKWWEVWKPEKKEIGRRFPKYLDKEHIYYERAFDKNGIGLMCGDNVKVLTIENNPPETKGGIYKIVEIFEGDLRLKDGENYFYCWPRNVELSGGYKRNT